jgi:hypothetical protein
MMRAIAIAVALGVAFVVSLAGCLPDYKPVLNPVTFGCLDVAVHAVWRGPQKGPIVVWDLGNSCEHSVSVDLGAATVVAGDREGHKVSTVAYDPDHEIRVRRIDARTSGQEWIEYRPTTEMSYVDWLDVDVGGVSSEPRTTRWIRAEFPAELSR